MKKLTTAVLPVCPQDPLRVEGRLALLMSGPVGIRDLWPGTFGYRLRHAALSGINP
jgi:hypothetical protein